MQVETIYKLRKLIIANSAVRTSLAIYHLISNARSWNNPLHNDNQMTFVGHIVYVCPS